MLLREVMQEKLSRNTLFESPGRMLHHLCVDGMHVGDLGPCQDAAGSLRHIEVSSTHWLRSSRSGLIFVNEQLRHYCSASPKLTPMQIKVAMINGAHAIYPSPKAKRRRRDAGQGMFARSRIVTLALAVVCRSTSERAIALQRARRSTGGSSWTASRGLMTTTAPVAWPYSPSMLRLVFVCVLLCFARCLRSSLCGGPPHAFPRAFRA